MSENTKVAARTKIQKVFTYIRELTKLRMPPTSTTSSYEWSLKFSSLPSYPSIQIAVLGDELSDDFDGAVLRVKRPEETQCPEFPPILDDWISSGWERVTGDVTYFAAKNQINSEELTETITFESDPERVNAFAMWTEKRKRWQEAEIPVREARSVFAELFKLQGQLQRESEKYQLYLGDGHLVWESAEGAIEHPVLLKKVELEFDSAVPEFVIREMEEPSELYTTLLRHHELEGNAVLQCKSRVQETEPHPMAGSKTTEFLKFFIQRFFQDGKYCESKSEIRPGSAGIFRDPVLFLGNRSQGFAEALDRLIEAMPEVEVLPEALMRIVGVEESDEGSESSQAADQSRFTPEKEVDFLLTKPSNKEQERVLTQLENTGSVLVQGPPGTGKSHTIANIIGHLLASGKTVLVSSHTSKALKVVREKVVQELQPLCVSVLENDTESKAQLEESINGIVSYLSRTDEKTLSKEIEQLGHRRTQIKEQVLKLEAIALEIRKGEYTDIVVAGEGIPPSEAARKVGELEMENGWIPSPVEYGAPNPLSEAEVADLYDTNVRISLDDEKCIREVLPNLDGALKPSELRELIEILKTLDRSKSQEFVNLWKNGDQNVEHLEKLSTNLGKTLEIFTSHKWVQKVVEDSKLGKERLQPWNTLMELIEKTTQEVGRRSELVLKYGPVVSDEIGIETAEICNSIAAHLRDGKKLGFFTTLLNDPWKKFIAQCTVDDGHPTKSEHFESILALLEIKKLRRELSLRWERQVVALGGPKLESVEPEVFAKSFLDALKLASTWSTSAWSQIEQQLESLGFDLKSAIEKAALSVQASGYIEQLQTLAKNLLIPAIEARVVWIKLKAIETRTERTQQIFRVNVQKISNQTAYLRNMTTALTGLDAVAYEDSFNRYLDLVGKLSVFDQRTKLLGKMTKTASGWAKAIELRIPQHAGGMPPGDALTAWKVCQWRQEIDRRISQDYSAVRRDLQRLKTELSGVNSQFVEKLAWREQFMRTGLKEKQALVGWQKLQDKITKTGRGKRDAHVKREARKTLKDCKNAVPVWIMPLSRVFDSFDLVNTKFDVIILDEASQSDITALAAFAIAKQVIVVGDSEQVTPHAVGQELGKIQSLIDELLQGVPNRMLYDGKTSVYDLAEQAFGGTIRLVEHFRCVPDIIEFSNQLSYNGEIKPLREASSSPYQSHLVAHRVEGGKEQNKANPKEALEIASIVAAMTEMKEYEKSSIGVISMVGHDQSIEISTLLQRKIPTSVYARHSLLCGSASQFQGDERHVMILSMVDSCDSPPLAIRQTDSFKKTFNVAASRAKDQLWVVHSLNPATDLKPNDLRLRLIKHAENPKELRRAIEATQKKADPKSVVFEQMVIRELMLNGFRVIPQFSVGAYTIDMVIEGKDSKRIALECDGDKYHPPEKLADDIQRQMVLERLDWSFIRIRGTEFFRRREATMKRVIAELEAFGIERLGHIGEVSSESTHDELRQRVLQRAHQIRNEWEANLDPEEVVKPKRTKWWGKRTQPAESVKHPVDGSNALKVEPLMVSKEPPKETVVERIERQHTAPDHVQMPARPGWNELVASVGPNQMVAFLRTHQFEVIDKRPVGGALWVLDHPKFKELAAVLDGKGYRFVFAENGSGSTKDRPAWYSKRH